MQRLDGDAALLDATTDMHEATAVAGGNAVCASSGCIVNLVGQHCAGDLGVFYGEGATEAAADFRLFHFHQFYAGEGIEEGSRLSQGAQFPAEVTALVIGDFACRIGGFLFHIGVEVGDSEDVHDELGELEGAAGQG